MGTGVGLGAGMGLGAIMAQVLGQSMQQPQVAPPAAPAPAQPQSQAATEIPAAPAAPAISGPQSIEMAFTGLELLVSRQLAVPQEERNSILQKLAGLEVEFAKPDSDLNTIKSQRKALQDQWPWLKEEIDTLFRQPVIEQAMAEAARRFMES